MTTFDPSLTLGRKASHFVVILSKRRTYELFQIAQDT